MYVKCVPSAPEGHDHVQVSVSYWKGLGIGASAYPAKKTEYGFSVSLSLLCAPPTILLAHITRNNKKLVAQHEAQIKADIDNCSGAGWDLVLKCCAANGLTPLPLEQEQPA